MDSILGYILVSLISFIIYITFFRSIFTQTKPKLRLPPSPLALPIIGHLHLLQTPPHGSFQKLSNRYGPLIHLYLGSLPFIIVSSAEIAKEVLKTHEMSMCNRPANSAIRYLTYDASDLGFAPYGPYWKFMKKLCMSELLNGRMLDLLLPIRQEEIGRFLGMLHRKGEAREGVNVGAEASRLTNSVIMRMAIGKSCFRTEDEAREVTERVKEAGRLSGMFNLSDYLGLCKNLDIQGIGKKVKEVRGKFDRMMESIIEEHQEVRIIKSSSAKDIAPRDILDVLLDVSRDETSDVKITRDNIKGFLMDILSGGTDTSAVTIEWALAELLNHPRVMEKARKEIDSVIGKNRLVTERDIGNLAYVQAIVKETLRLHPPSPLIMRESTEYCTIAGYEIPANTRVFINAWAIGRDPKEWENPVEFNPERFVDGSGKKISNVEVRGQHYQLLPFGSGRRGCPGTSLALNVVHTTLAAMIQCFEWKVEGCVDMREGPEIILTRAQPLICVPIPRLTPFPSFSF